MVDVIVNAAGLVDNPHNKSDLTRLEAKDYAIEQMHEILSVLDLEPISATVTLWTEGEDRDPVQKVSMKIVYRTISQPIVQEAHSRSIKKAIDRCTAPMTRQVRKAKTKMIDKRRADSIQAKNMMQQKENAEQFDY